MNLISKKDLLAITGISYGQLYRWKRERLIPEEWFIKQSAYTGQETFFPREQILSRIKSILDLKDKYSLEELAKILSPEASVETVSWDNLRELSEIDEEFLEFLPDAFGKELYEFYDVTIMVAISQAAKKLKLDIHQTQELLVRSIPAALALRNSNAVCIVFQVENVYHTVFTINSESITFDDDIMVRDKITLSEVADIIKIKYKNLFMK